MHMPNIFQRLGRKRAQSLNSSFVPDANKMPRRSASEAVPPLTPPASPQKDESYRIVPPSFASKEPDRPSLPNSTQIDGKPNTSGRAPALPPSLPPANGHDASDDLSNKLAAAWDVANKNPTMSKSEKILQKMG
jgi:hypothetical protein